MMRIYVPDAVRGEPFDKLRANGANSVFEAKVGLHKRFTLPFVVSQSNHERPFDKPVLI
jgi:hypothetical protein